MNNIQKSIDYINKTYDKLSYFDLYGGSVFMCAMLIILLILYFQFTKINMNLEPVRQNWPKHRCNPVYMPFAGYIMKPKDTSWVKFAGNNATFCINEIFTNIVSNFTNPIKFILYPILGMWKIILSVLQSIRKMFKSIRDKMTMVVKNIMNRVASFIIVMQQIIISMRDLFAKAQGVAAAGLYTVLGSYYTLKSALGAILELVVIFLIAMAAMIVGFWLMPWTWWIAASMTVMFVAISVPLIIMTVWLSKIMNIKGSSPPGKPGRSSCFVGNTPIMLKNGETVNISSIKVGDILKDGGLVTGRFKLQKTDTDEIGQIYSTQVTGNHYVFHNGAWIKSREHPDYNILLDSSDVHNLYCLNVSTKKIHIGNLVFSDWDDMIKPNEVYDFMKQIKDTVTPSLSETELYNPENIHTYFDGGLDELTYLDTMDGAIPISKIKLGTKVGLGNTVIGVVKIYAKDIEQLYYNVAVGRDRTHVLRGGRNIVYKLRNDNGHSEKPVSTIFKFLDKKIIDNESRTKVLYHLITEKGEFTTEEGLTILDYNSCLDHFE
jgi:hypothetical protein